MKIIMKKIEIKDNNKIIEEKTEVAMNENKQIKKEENINNIHENQEIQ